jgi:hypothetical protein
VAGGRR